MYFSKKLNLISSGIYLGDSVSKQSFFSLNDSDDIMGPVVSL